MVDISDCALTRKQVEKLLSDCEVQSGSKAYWFKVDEKASWPAVSPSSSPTCGPSWSRC